MSANSRRFYPANIAGFALALLFAWFFEWKTADLVWSLWLTSLLMGYATIILTIVAGMIFAFKAMSVDDDKEGAAGSKVGGGIVFVLGAVFLFCFFSVHFCGFHLVHGVFLAFLFPLENIPDPHAFDGAVSDPLHLLKFAFTEVLPCYFWFIIPAVLLDWRKLFGALFSSIRFDPMKDEKQEGKSGCLGDPFIGPYKNVVKMHLLIFLFMGVQFIGLQEHFIIYAVVYSVYFFPWSMFRRKSLPDMVE